MLDVQVPVSVAGAEGEEARLRIKDADPGPLPLSWTLADFNNHLVRVGKRRPFNIRITGGEDE